MLTGWRDFDDTLRTMDRLQRHLDRAFTQWSGGPLFSLYGPSYGPERARDQGATRYRLRGAWPLTNVFETKEAFVVKAEVPGLAESDVAVSVEDDALVIRGERKSDVPQGYTVHLRERAPVAFTRKLPLPARVDSGAVTATLNQGLLTVTLPKAKDALPRQIAVKAG